MINPKKEKLVLPSGPVVRHVHNVCSSKEAYITYVFRAHATEVYINYVLLVDKASLKAYILAFPTDTHKHVHEAYRCPDLGIATIRLRGEELEGKKYDLIRFLKFEELEELIRFDEFSPIKRMYKPKNYIDVRFDHVNSVSVKRVGSALKAEIHVIRSSFLGLYDKIRLSFDGEKIYEEEEKDEIPLIE